MKDQVRMTMVGRNPAASLGLSRRALSTIILSAGFSLTGAGTVMLGVLLPTLSHRWALRDDQAGLFLFLQFCGSGLGAIATGLNRIRSLASGYGLMAVTLGVLTLGGSATAHAAFFFYGLGLGMAMTSTSLLFSDRWGQDRAAKLEWLNFVWSVGAMAGPVFFLPFLRRNNDRALFWAMLAFSLGMFLWTVLIERQEVRSTLGQQSGRSSHLRRVAFPLLLLLAMGVVGVEVSLSGWLTTYSHRSGMHSVAEAALATSIFWLGEMSSRLAFSTDLLAKVGRRVVLRWGLLGVTASAFAVIAAPRPGLILVAAWLAGAFVGPLYPLSLSFLLEFSPWGWFFSVGGLGAALFPWITGLISTHFHSLRVGLVVPCAAGLALIALNELIFRYLGSAGAMAGEPQVRS
jgi:MFS transporter, FHS family, glucose/mannose:H+ symporter